MHYFLVLSKNLNEFLVFKLLNNFLCSDQNPISSIFPNILNYTGKQIKLKDKLSKQLNQK